MEITGNDCLRSLTSEAGRQSDYYHRRQMPALTQMWAGIEALAFEASRSSGSLGVELNNTRVKDNPPIPIKAGEQHQQLPNHNVIKAFQ